MTIHRVLAHNDATESENRIHADSEARRYGFSGGLVPGVTVHAYLCHPPARQWGRAWLERGTLSSRFVQPVYDGDEVTVEAEAREGVGVEVGLVGPSGEVCATAVATLPDAGRAAPDIAAFPSHGPPPADERRPASADVLLSTSLGAIEATWRAERAVEYLDEIGDDLPLYREERVAHPSWLLRFANRVLSSSVRLGPWIHVSSDVTHHGLVRDGEKVSTRALVREVFERKGHRFVELDVVMLVNGGQPRPVMSVRHVAIYEPRAIT